MEVRNSKIHGGMAGCFGAKSCHDNELYHISAEHAALDSCPHSQVIEDEGNLANDMEYNNLIHDNVGRHGQNVGVVTLLCDSTSFYNNVMWNNNAPGYNGNIRIGSGCNGSGSSAVANIYNNTVDCSNGVGCFETDTKPPALPGTVNLRNNVFITGSNPIILHEGISTFNNSNNYSMSTSEANSYGFTSARKYNPSSADPHVSGQGVDLVSSLSSALNSVLGALAYDAQGAPWFGGSYVRRGSNWDLGAYAGSGQSSSAPSPSKPVAPTGLSASVQ